MRGCLIYRAERFSPNAVNRDRAVLEAVRQRLEEVATTATTSGKLTGIAPTEGEIVETTDGTLQIISLNEDELTEMPLADFCITMARSRKALEIISKAEDCGMAVANSGKSLLNCTRSYIERLMRAHHLPASPLYSGGKGWIKRGDGAAQERSDVRFVANADEMARAEREFRARGVTDVVKTDHIEGDLVKFYGVRDSNFFFTTYPTDGNYSKFGDESINGTAQHTPFDREQLWQVAERIAELTGIDIYGGDCIVRAGGEFAVIDFNDFPSFASCRNEAARAITDKILKTLNT